jgi:MFS family permease
VTDRLDGRFAKLWTAATTSALGTGLQLVATPLLIASRTHNPLVVSGASAVSWLPWLLFALPGGVLVDRVDRRRLMIALDSSRAVMLLVLATMIAAGHVSIVALYVVLFFINTGEVVFRTASQAMIQAVVPRSRLERANGWLMGGATVTQQMLAGPLGGFLFAVAVAIPYYVNAGTYVSSAIAIALVAGRFRAVPAARDQEPSFRREISDGMRWLLRHRLLRTMALLIGLLNLTLTAALAVLVLLARERLHLGSVGYGTLIACMAVGGLLGAVIGDRLVGKVTATWTVRVGLLVEAGTHLALASATTAWIVGVALFAFGVHGSLWTIVSGSLRQRLIPPEMLGRVTSASLFLSAGGNCLGAVLGGVVASRFGITAPYWVGFVVALGVSAATWRVFSRPVVAAAYVDPIMVPQDSGEYASPGGA